jgi:hypothetical protein
MVEEDDDTVVAMCYAVLFWTDFGVMAAFV